MMRKPYIIGLAVLVVIVAVIGWGVLSPENTENTTGDSLSNQSKAEPNFRKGRERQEGRMSRRQSAGKQVGEKNSEQGEYPEIELEEVTALIDSGEIMGMELRGHGGNLVNPNEPLATALKLSQDESDAINKLWSRIRPKLNELRAEHVKTQTMADGEVWIGVEVFSDEGDVLRQAFIGEAMDLIGEQRAGMLLQGIKAHGAYGRWGKIVGSGFSIKVRVQDDGSYLYEIAEQAQSDGKAGLKWRSDRVPAHLEVLAKAAGIELKP